MNHRLLLAAIAGAIAAAVALIVWAANGIDDYHGTEVDRVYPRESA